MLIHEHPEVFLAQHYLHQQRILLATLLSSHTLFQRGNTMKRHVWMYCMQICSNLVHYPIPLICLQQTSLACSLKSDSIFQQVHLPNVRTYT